jgi:KDO2-lipid IV(A) lauroyltransferase
LRSLFFMAGRPLRKEIKYTLLYWFVRSLIFASNRMPRTWWLAFCGFLGRIAYVFSPKPRELARTHLRLAFSKDKSPGEIDRLTYQMFIMLGKNAGETLRATGIKSLADMEKFLVVEGYEHVEAARAKGKGIIFIPIHLGAFELMVTFTSLKGLKPMVIGTPLKDERLNELMFKYRSLHGSQAVERGKETVRIFKGLKQGGTTAILIDQDTKVKSRFVNFFGMPASTPVGATILALKSGAAIVPAYIHLGKDNKEYIRFLPEILPEITGDEETDLIRNTQNYTNYVEDAIRAHPEQWVWMHERWKTKPGEEIR